MNKKERLVIISSFIALWVIAKYNSAIAETLNKDKKINKTEQTTNLQEQTNNELNLNLISPPDTMKLVKDLFYDNIVETAQEKIDADKMWNNAMISPHRDVTKELIIMVYGFYWEKSKYNLLLFTTLLLDPNHQYWLSQEAYNIVKNDKGKTMLFESLMRNFSISIENKELDKEIKELDEILKALKEMTKVYENYLKNNPQK